MSNVPKLNGVVFHVKPLVWKETGANPFGMMSYKAVAFGLHYRVECLSGVWYATWHGYPLFAGGYKTCEMAQEACYHHKVYLIEMEIGEIINKYGHKTQMALEW